MYEIIVHTEPVHTHELGEAIAAMLGALLLFGMIAGLFWLLIKILSESGDEPDSSAANSRKSRGSSATPSARRAASTSPQRGKEKARNKAGVGSRPSGPFLRASVRCHKCGKQARLERIEDLKAKGKRGVYLCQNRHHFRLDRNDAVGPPRKGKGRVTFRRG